MDGLNGNCRVDLYCDVLFQEIKASRVENKCNNYVYIPREGNGAALAVAHEPIFLSYWHCPNHIRDQWLICNRMGNQLWAVHLSGYDVSVFSFSINPKNKKKNQRKTAKIFHKIHINYFFIISKNNHISLLFLPCSLYVHFIKKPRISNSRTIRVDFLNPIRWLTKQDEYFKVVLH